MGGNKPSRSPVAIIMAGGSGTRFWPLSQKNTPKQYLRLSGPHSLIQQTIARIGKVCKLSDTFICSGKSQFSLIKEQLPDVSGLILEPQARNTSACLMLSVSHLIKKGYSFETPMMVFPADHYIENEIRFEKLLHQAVSFSQKEPSLITLGVVPTSPHTGYGYIETEPQPYFETVLRAKRFTEKPKLEIAKEFLKNRNYYWNSGIFVWTIGTIVSAFEQFLSEQWKQIHAAQTDAEIAAVFSTLPSAPIDTAIMEKASNVFLIPADQLGWSDLGSWGALYDLKAAKPGENIALTGEVLTLGSEGCLVNVSPEMKVALIGTKNLIVVEHNGFLLISERNQDQKVKEAAQHFDR